MYAPFHTWRMMPSKLLPQVQGFIWHLLCTGACAKKVVGTNAELQHCGNCAGLDSVMQKCSFQAYSEEIGSSVSIYQSNFHVQNCNARGTEGFCGIFLYSHTLVRRVVLLGVAVSGSSAK